MSKSRSGLIFMILILILIYSFGVFYGFMYEDVLDNNTTYIFNKSEVRNLELDYDIFSRSLTLDESKINTYTGYFKSDFLKNDSQKKNCYLMIENPECQSLVVKVNNKVIGHKGDLDMESNLWNGVYFFEIDSSGIKDINSIEITLNSSYITGLSGELRILNYEEYKEIDKKTRLGTNITMIALVISFFTAFIIALIVIAWRKQLYNISEYVYFLITIIALGVSLFDYMVIDFLPFEYLLFKKIIIISYHVAITFYGLAVAKLLNSRVKISIGVLGLIGALYYSLTTSTSIEFREHYLILNYFLLFGMIQLMITLAIKMKRSPANASLILVSSLIGFLTALKLVLGTNNVIETSSLIDLPILIIVLVLSVLFIFYLELSQMVSGNEAKCIKKGRQDITNYMQGSFTIDNKYNVVGSFSSTCNHIFGKFIVGAIVFDLLVFPDDDMKFLENTFESIFNEKYKFKEGFISLLPDEISIRNRTYQIDYEVIKRTETLILITLSDVTRSKRLEIEMIEEKKISKLIINALKSKQEVGYLIKTAETFILSLGGEGITDKLLEEMHTLKGNLGQFGFYKFENELHDIESQIESEGENVDIYSITLSLKNALDECIKLLNEYLDIDFTEVGYEDINISKEVLLNLEQNYLELAGTEEFNLLIYNSIQNLRRIDIKDMLRRYVEYVDKLSKDHGKAIFPVIIEGDEIFVLPEKFEALISALVGVFRNSIIHGVETPEERVKVNKDSYGVITCQVQDIGKMIKIIIKDDGRGIDFEKIYEKALAADLISSETVLSEMEKTNLVFLRKLSQMDEVDIYSGRGVGLTALASKVEELNGVVDIYTKVGELTEFRIEIPK